MKKRFLTIALAGLLALTLAACGVQPEEPAQEKQTEAVTETTEDAQTSEEQAAPATEQEAMAQALLDQARSGYGEGECAAEGHVILSTSSGDNTDTEVYALCSVGNYGFVNGNFEEVSGSGAIPSRLTFRKDENGGLTLVDFWQAEDGSRYVDSIRETFPEKLVAQALDAQSYYQDLKAQKVAYALAYLEEIGREAQIGDYADFDHPLAVDQGMPGPVSDELMNERWEYPFFLGSEERLEDGVRWIYSNEWAPSGNGGTVTYTKTNFDTGEIAEKYVYRVVGDTYTEVTESED